MGGVKAQGSCLCVHSMASARTCMQESGFAAMYREANALLKSLHFQRVKRAPAPHLPAS